MVASTFFLLDLGLGLGIWSNLQLNQLLQLIDFFPQLIQLIDLFLQLIQLIDLLLQLIQLIALYLQLLQLRQIDFLDSLGNPAHIPDPRLVSIRPVAYLNIHFYNPVSKCKHGNAEGGTVGSDVKIWKIWPPSDLLFLE